MRLKVKVAPIFLKFIYSFIPIYLLYKYHFNPSFKYKGGETNVAKKKKKQSKVYHPRATGNSTAGEDDVPCCPATTKKGGGGFMNMLCKALGCCGLLSACYDPPTPH
ncbi:hypothetical protein E1A91_A10G200600v1 [Gossypium mustelinum]|uniref:Cysteine-rich transmembrane CYSTM domain-containing protein n=1 Tax=Gossypium mustelinum TaxID=34275 RepID=A0A5D2XP85_GOSMU|nr:hypothetical protein E1A91_A10G200600v1 [Gossypium mustelinum]